MEDEFEFYNDDDDLFYEIPPEKQKGFMKLHHYITENLVKQHLNGCEYAIVLLLLRMTLGYRERKETNLSLKFLRDRTGYNINHINRALHRLIERRIVERTQTAAMGRASRYTFNDNIEEWAEK